MSSEYNSQSIRAIIGLGNPGSQFIWTRHNIGFRVVDYLANRYGATWRVSGNLEFATIHPSNYTHSIILIKPLTFMNDSGRIAPFLGKKGIKAEECIVVHDELEKKFMTMRISCGGSPRGHNGIKSLQSVIGASFWRLRIGIDRPDSNDKDVVGAYVLGSFTKAEEDILGQSIEKAAELLLS